MRTLLIILLALSATGCAMSTKVVYRTCQVLAASAHGADLATSEYLFGMEKENPKGRKETNVLLGHFTTQPVWFGVTKASIATAGLIAVDQIPNKKIGAAVNCGTAVAYAFVVKNNADIIQGRKR